MNLNDLKHFLDLSFMDTRFAVIVVALTLLGIGAQTTRIVFTVNSLLSEEFKNI